MDTTQMVTATNILMDYKPCPLFSLPPLQHLR